MVVQTELTKLGLHPISVQLGVVELVENAIEAIKQKELEQTLQRFGFEILLDKKRQIVEQIKTAIIELVHYTTAALKVNLSGYLSEKLAQNYASLSATFSELEGITIEKYFIQQKIEKVKELLTYDEKSLSEIAYFLNYSSVAHLSTQFKKITGETPSAYKVANSQTRKTIDEV
jgi:YesN/AraC family two-component response regulator